MTGPSWPGRGGCPGSAHPQVNAAYSEAAWPIRPASMWRVEVAMGLTVACFSPSWPTPTKRTFYSPLAQLGADE